MHSGMALRAIVVVASSLFLSACGGGESRPDYRDVLMQRYPPLSEALDAAVEPCQAEDLPTCRSHSAEALEASRHLLEGLESADVPDGLEEADRQFRKGLNALAANLEKTLAAIDAGNEDELASLRTCCSGASADVSNPVGLFNQELDLDLKQ